jgi:AraC-like DNA-binding protein
MEAVHQARAAKRPLRRFPVLQAAGVEAVQASVSSLLTPFRVMPRRRSTRAEVLGDVSAIRFGPVSLIYARNVGAELDVQITQRVSYYDVNFALEGANGIETPEEQVVLSARRAGVISPQMMPTMHLSDGYGQLHVRIERSALERHLERVLGGPVTGPIRFRMEMDLTAPAVASWAGMIRLLIGDLDEPSGLTAAGAEISPWSDFLMTGLLLAQPHNYSERLARRPSDATRPRSVKRVLDLVEREPAGDLSLARLAAAAGLGPRALQRNFREYVGVSPREYVQWIRLGRAHNDLVVGAGGTVAEIAFRWGFTHVPRFAGAYQERYGVAPSMTLRAARPGPARNLCRIVDRQVAQRIGKAPLVF